MGIGDYFKRSWQKHLVSRDYKTGAHFLRVVGRQAKTITRLKTGYVKKGEEYAQRRTALTSQENQLNAKVRELDDRERTITAKEEELGREDNTVEAHLQRILSLEKRIIVGDIREKKLRQAKTAVEQKIDDYQNKAFHANRRFKRQGEILKNLIAREVLEMIVSGINNSIDEDTLAVVVNYEDEIVYASPALTKLLDYETQEVIGRKYINFLENQEERFLSSLEKEGGLVFKTKKGKRVVVEASKRIHSIIITSPLKKYPTEIHFGVSAIFKIPGVFRRKKVRTNIDKERQEANEKTIGRMVEQAYDIYLKSKGVGTGQELGRLEENTRILAKKLDLDYNQIREEVMQERKLKDQIKALEINNKYNQEHKPYPTP